MKFIDDLLKFLATAKREGIQEILDLLAEEGWPDSDRFEICDGKGMDLTGYAPQEVLRYIKRKTTK